MVSPQIPPMTEGAFQTAVVDLAHLLRLRTYHTHDSRRSDPGFPDLVIVGPRGVLFRELKTQRGRVRPEQHQWLIALDDAGADAAVWRPADLASGAVLRDLRTITLTRPFDANASNQPVERTSR